MNENDLNGWSGVDIVMIVQYHHIIIKARLHNGHYRYILVVTTFSLAFY